MADTSTITLARALLSAWVARFGVPLRITSDRGAQFTSKLWADLSELLGIQLSVTTAYHPQANGLVERFHRHLKEALKACLTGHDWADQLPWVLLGLRSEPKQDLKTSVSELVYGSPISVPGDMVQHSTDDVSAMSHLRQLHAQVGLLHPIPTSCHGEVDSAVPHDLMEAKFVFVRHGAHTPPLQPPYDGPFAVVKAGKKSFRLQMGEKEETVLVDRIKVAYLEPGIVPLMVNHPRRGRPPRSPPEKLQDVPKTVPAIRGRKTTSRDVSSAPPRLRGATSSGMTSQHRGIRSNNSEEVHMGFSRAGRQLTMTDHYVP